MRFPLLTLGLVVVYMPLWNILQPETFTAVLCFRAVCALPNAIEENGMIKFNLCKYQNPRNYYFSQNLGYFQINLFILSQTIICYKYCMLFFIPTIDLDLYGNYNNKQV